MRGDKSRLRLSIAEIDGMIFPIAALSRSGAKENEGFASLTRKDFFVWIPCKSLKSPESAKGIQGNPSLFLWISLDLFGARRSPDEERI
jgi:hypothetical protein